MQSWSKKHIPWKLKCRGGGADKLEVGGRNGGRGLLQAEKSISAVFRIVCINIAMAQIVQEQLVTALKVCRYRYRYRYRITGLSRW